MSNETKEKISNSKTNKRIGKKRKTNSKYLGITESKKDGKWVSQIRNDKKHILSGDILKKKRQPSLMIYATFIFQKIQII